MGILFKSAERFSGFDLRISIHYLMPTFREHCSSLHQGEKNPEDSVPGSLLFALYISN